MIVCCEMGIEILASRYAYPPNTESKTHPIATVLEKKTII